jgi:hypothetical protein
LFNLSPLSPRKNLEVAQYLYLYKKAIILSKSFGKDRLGNLGMKKGDATGEDTTLRNNFKGGSPLALETLQNKTLLEGLEKKISLKREESSLLDESQIRE